MSFLDRTRAALGDNVLQKLASLNHCVVGCGGTGANFAELLVRSGANDITLIDGALVKDSDLNRIPSFSRKDIDRPKAEALRDRLGLISRDISVHSFVDNFRGPEDLLPGYEIGQQVRDAVHDADIVFIATDTNLSRIAIETLCRNNGKSLFLSCGVHIQDEFSCFECSWRPRTPEHLLGREGYGPRNASYASIVQEAASVSFTMLLHHLRYPDGTGDFKYYFRKYDRLFMPVDTLINEKPSNNIFSL